MTTATYEALTAQSKGKRCVVCDSGPRVAFLGGEYRLRCNCYPNPPMLGKGIDIEKRRLAQMTEQSLAQRPQTPPLTLQEVQRFIAPLATEQEAHIFLRLCQAKGLNPFTGDAYLVKYDKASKAAIVIGVEVYMRKAALNPAFAGFDSGVVVVRKGEVVEMVGTLLWPGDTLLGAWCSVHRKGVTQPQRWTVSFSEYNKNQSLWKDKPATMIVKVATKQALQRFFPEEIGQFEAGLQAEGLSVVSEVETPEVIETTGVEVPGQAGLFDESPQDAKDSPVATKPAQARTAPQKAKEGECEIASDTCVKIAADFTDRGKIMSHFQAFHKVGIGDAQACFPLTSDGQRQTIQNLTIAQLLEACKQAAQHAAS